MKKLENQRKKKLITQTGPYNNPFCDTVTDTDLEPLSVSNRTAIHTLRNDLSQRSPALSSATLFKFSSWSPVENSFKISF